MTPINITINGQAANVRDIEEIGFRSVFEDEYNELELSVDTIVLVNESRDQIYDWIYGNNPGVWVGIPATVSLGTISLDYFIDLTQDPKFRDREVEVQIKRRYSKDSFFNLMRGHSFELLARKGVVYPTFNLPYVIVPDDQVAQGIALSSAIFQMAQTAAQAIKDTVEITAEFVAALDISPSHAISAGIKAAAKIAYTTTIILAIVDLVKRLRELVFPKIRYMKVCRVKDLISVSANYFGFQYESSALDSFGDLTLIPVPLTKGKKSIFRFKSDDIGESFTKGYPSSSDSVASPGALIEAIELMVNGKTQVNNGDAQTERRDFWQAIPGVQKIPFLNVKETLQNEFTLNTSEGWIRYYLHYLIDSDDINTMDNFDPTDVEYGTRNITEIAPDLNLNRGLVEAVLPFSLATPKDDFSWVENIALNLFNAIDEIAGTNTANLIENRIGAMVISQEFYSRTKLGVVQNGRLKLNQEDIIGAAALWNNFHSIESPEQNSYRIFDNSEITLNFDEFEQIRQYNNINMNGTICEILNVLYIPYSSKASIKYRVPDNYSVGKLETFAVNI